jgi:RNA polymerase sigma-70 factor (ECF subfamily)
VWLGPLPDAGLTWGASPAEAVYEQREAVELAFIAALQHLPALQRAVLVLRDVLGYRAGEVAAMLRTSTASVNSALQRARATLDELDLADAEAPTRPSTEDEQRLLDQYLAAFAEYDIDRIVALLRYDVVFDMPPLPLWVRGPADVGAFMLGPGAACRGSKLIALSANGLPAYASYKPDSESGAWLPWSVTLLEMEPDAGAEGAGAACLTGVHNFLAPFMPNLFTSFGLPEQLDESAPTITALP